MLKNYVKIIPFFWKILWILYIEDNCASNEIYGKILHIVRLKKKMSQVTLSKPIVFLHIHFNMFPLQSIVATLYNLLTKIPHFLPNQGKGKIDQYQRKF